MDILIVLLLQKLIFVLFTAGGDKQKNFIRHVNKKSVYD